MGSAPICMRWQQDIEPLMTCSAFLPDEFKVLLPVRKKITPEELRALVKPIVQDLYGTLYREDAEINTWRDSLIHFPEDY